MYNQLFPIANLTEDNISRFISRISWLKIYETNNKVPLTEKNIKQFISWRNRKNESFKAGFFMISLKLNYI